MLASSSVGHDLVFAATTSLGHPQRLCATKSLDRSPRTFAAEAAFQDKATTARLKPIRVKVPSWPAFELPNLPLDPTGISFAIRQSAIAPLPCTFSSLT